jgi:hypothetical protein
LRVICGLHEAVDEAITEIVIRSHPSVDLQHAGLSFGCIRVAIWSAKYLSPVPRQTLDMIRMTRMGKRMVEHRVVQAPLVVSGRKPQKGGCSTGEFEN